METRRLDEVLGGISVCYRKLIELGAVMNIRFGRAALLFAVYASLTSPAYAYLDPATGSIAIQALIGVVATWIMYSKMFAQKVRSFFGKLARKKRNASTPE